MNTISEPKYLNDKAYLKIKELIIKDQLKGPMISENELAALLGMSRTPIREALSRLASDNFVEIYPRKGIYIKEITVEETNNIMDVRLAIEVFSIDNLAKIFSDEHMDFLNAKVIEQEIAYENGQIYEFIKFDLEYHAYLLEVTNNHYFVRILNNVSDRSFHSGMKIFKRDITRIGESIVDHKEINESLKNREFDKAKIIMEQHILKGKKHFLS